MTAGSGGARVLRRPAPWTLRTRLVAGLLALLAAVSIVVGVVSVTALDRYLGAQLDERLASAVERSERSPGPPGRDDEDDDDLGFLVAPGQAEGTIGVLLVDEEVVAAGVLGKRELEPLSSSDVSALTQLPTDGRPATVDLGGELGQYRVAAVPASAGTVRVTGLPLAPLQATVARLSAVVVAVTLLGLVAAGAAGAYVVRLGLRPLRRVAATASRVTELPLDRGAVALAERVPEADADPRTEVGRVGAALNRMLEHVASALEARQASETRVRTFVADASHELRTPLASIRGYAELTRRQRASLPVDVARALDRVESESLRMTALVEDLLLLARLDEGRALGSEPVDLVGVVVDLVGDAHAAAPDHRFLLRLPDHAVVVTGDAAQLHQVVANLLGNTRTHTPPGTTVSVGLAEDAGHAVVTVEDDGPGIPGRLQPEVFSRFVRGDESRSRASGSNGLGLAIVASVVAAHGGTVDLRSRPGSTVVTVRLPLSGSAEAAAASAQVVAVVP